jgi:hypothetical protein
MFDCARFRNRAFENSLTAYNHAISHQNSLVTSESAHIFLSILIHGKMNGSERASSNLILDYVLVDAVFSLAIFLVICVFGSRIQGFLDLSVLRGMAAVVSERALVGRRRAALGSENLLSGELSRSMTNRWWIIGGLPCSVVPGMSREMPVLKCHYGWCFDDQGLPNYHAMVRSPLPLLCLRYPPHVRVGNRLRLNSCLL